MPSRFNIRNSMLLLSQGMILVLFSSFIFTHPDNFLDRLRWASGVVALCTSMVHFAGYFFGEDRGRFFPDLVAALIFSGIGLVLLDVPFNARKWLTPAMTALLILLPLNVFLAALGMRYAFKWWWLSLASGLVSFLIIFLLLSRSHIPGLPISIFIAVQMLTLGALMVWMSIIDRKLEKEYKKTIRELRGM